MSPLTQYVTFCLFVIFSICFIGWFFGPFAVLGYLGVLYIAVDRYL